MNSFARTVKLGLFGLLLIFLAYQLWIFGHVLAWRWIDPGETSFMSLRLSEMRETDPDAKLQHEWVPYAQISNRLKRAVVAAEDDKFVEHDGFDWDGIESAMKKNEKKGKPVSGGSTISQQLAKNLFLSPTRSYVRKAEEALITVMIETLWDKQRILEVYLNVVEWGDGVFGAEAAARRYFGSSAAQLGAEQAARLAVMLPAPRRYERNPYSAYMNGRTQLILGRMGGAEVP